jgi:hypothetical protein
LVIAMASSFYSARKYCGPFLARRVVVPAFIILCSFCIGTTASVAAESGFPISVSAGTHSLTVPWHPGPVTNRLNPAFVVGTDHTLRPGGRVRLYGTANIGAFQNYWWMTGVYLSTEGGAGYAFRFGLHTDVRLGLGYLHYFWRRKTLELKNGAYVQTRNWGKPSVLVPLSIILGYRGSPARPLAVAPFIAAQWAVQAPFTDESPAMTHFFLSVGVRINLWRAAPADRR